MIVLNPEYSPEEVRVAFVNGPMDGKTGWLSRQSVAIFLLHIDEETFGGETTERSSALSPRLAWLYRRTARRVMSLDTKTTYDELFEEIRTYNLMLCPPDGKFMVDMTSCIHDHLQRRRTRS
jgi:hypothetical protein